MEKRVLSWLSKRVALPLAPFFLGAFIRYIHLGHLERSIFDPVYLSFSMAILSLLVLLSVKKLDDKDAAEIFSNIYIILFILFCVMFGLAVFLKVQLDSYHMSLINGFRQSLRAGQVTPDTVIQALSGLRDQEINSSLLIIQMCTVGLSVMAVPFTVWLIRKYGLED